MNLSLPTSPRSITMSFPNFEAAGKGVLAFLQQRLGFDLWMITRTEGADWIVLQTRGEGVNAGAVLNWADSVCFEMVNGDGPRIAPMLDQVPAYFAAPITRQMPIKAYIGVPINYADGSLFGTLCAVDPVCQPAELIEEQGLLELLAGLLSSILTSDLTLAEQTRRSERHKMEAQTDSLTALANRRAWQEFMLTEEDRCKRYGHPATVFSIDLDELKAVNDSQGHAAGDALLVRTAQALCKVVREVDVVARLGGDEFGIVAVECDQAVADLLLARLQAAFDENQVKASIGVAVRNPAAGLNSAWALADQRMYEQKRARARR